MVLSCGVGLCDVPVEQMFLNNFRCLKGQVDRHCYVMTLGSKEPLSVWRSDVGELICYLVKAIYLCSACIFANKENPAKMPKVSSAPSSKGSQPR